MCNGTDLNPQLGSRRPLGTSRYPPKRRCYCMPSTLLENLARADMFLSDGCGAWLHRLVDVH